jgi:hypothetical protein
LVPIGPNCGTGTKPYTAPFASYVTVIVDIAGV